MTILTSGLTTFPDFLKSSHFRHLNKYYAIPQRNSNVHSLEKSPLLIHSDISIHIIWQPQCQVRKTEKRLKEGRNEKDLTHTKKRLLKGR